MPHQLINPRRDEALLDGGTVSHRYVKFFEEITNISNQQSSQLGNTVIVSGSYLTIGAVTVICTGISTITLNTNPEDRERVTVNRTNGEVTVTSGARLINTESTIILSKDTTSLDFFFSIEQNQWYIV